MVSCGRFKMLPMAPRSAMPIPPSSKPKIGFSIDSIVGNSEYRGNGQDSSLSPRSESPDRPSSSLSDSSYPLELRNSEPQNNSSNQINVNVDRGQTVLSTDFHRNYSVKFSQACSDSQESLTKSRLIHSDSPTNVQTPVSPDLPERLVPLTPSPPMAHLQPSSKGPVMVPGIPAGLIRPFPVQPPPYMNTPEVVGSNNPHFLAAQFQMAAALAHGQTAQGFSAGSGLPQHHSQFNNPNIVRDSYPLYPWLISRHGRIFPHRFPGNLLLHPFRKPKRVRTAFSPSQLLKLEHAFESNHYVVGAERKTLAQALSLTETQVKVWFQNRRTKHKRMQQEEDAKNCGSSSSGNNGETGIDQKHLMGDSNSSTQASFEEDEEDELIDMDDCPSDQESDQIQ